MSITCMSVVWKFRVYDDKLDIVLNILIFLSYVRQYFNQMVPVEVEICVVFLRIISSTLHLLCGSKISKIICHCILFSVEFLAS